MVHTRSVSNPHQWKRRPSPGGDHVLPCSAIAELSAALNRRDTPEQAREALAKHCETMAQLDRAVNIFRVWQGMGGTR